MVLKSLQTSGSFIIFSLVQLIKLKRSSVVMVPIKAVLHVQTERKRENKNNWGKRVKSRGIQRRPSWPIKIKF